MGETDLNQLLLDMQPGLDSGRYFFASVDESLLMALSNYLDYIVAIFREKEGLSIAFHEDVKEGISELTADVSGPFALITLRVNSDLMAVGFLAKLSSALADAGISVNAYSAYHHDHLFVPYGKKDEAMKVLEQLKPK